MVSFLRKIRTKQRCYVVCAVARSGSNLLTDGLHATGRAGRPKQFFCPLFENQYANKYGLDPAQDFAGYIRGVIEASSSSNRIFGFKLMGWYLDWFIERLRGGGTFQADNEFALLQEAFPNLQLIRIQRRDTLRQAISKARAYQTGQWKVRDDEIPRSEPMFDAALIDRCLDEIRRESNVWTQFFERTGVRPFEIDYEELCQDYHSTLARALDYLKIAVPTTQIPSRPITIKQSDATSAEWEQRYRAINSDRMAMA